MLACRMPVVFVAAILLGGCGAPAMFSSGPDAYDGVWSGRMTFALGAADCPRQAGLQVEISNGLIAGDARWGTERGVFRAAINEDGTLRSASITHGRSSFADLEGAFGETTASGTWTSRRCEGDWDLRKVRGL